jgi:hypothetical protein
LLVLFAVDQIHADTFGNVVDDGHRRQDHQDDEQRLVPVIDADAIRKLQPDAAGAERRWPGRRRREAEPKGIGKDQR